MTTFEISPALPADRRAGLHLPDDGAAGEHRTVLNELDLSRLEAGQLHLERAVFNLRATLDETMKSLAVKAHAKGLELNCHLPRHVPENLIGDPWRLRQIVSQLVDNAVKSTERGEIAVRVAVDSQTVGDVCLRFSVADTGIGSTFGFTATFPIASDPARQPGPDSALLAQLRELPAEVFDLADALEGVDGRYDRLQKMVEFYFSEAPLLLAQMRTGLERQDASAITRAAHRLAGTLVYLKAPPALAAARRVDDLGVSGDLKAAAAAIPALEHELARLEQTLAPHRAGPQKHA